MANSMKTLSLGPFDLIGKLVSVNSSQPEPSFDDLLSYYHYDFGIMPLMLQVRGPATS